MAAKHPQEEQAEYSGYWSSLSSFPALGSYLSFVVDEVSRRGFEDAFQTLLEFPLFGQPEYTNYWLLCEIEKS